MQRPARIGIAPCVPPARRRGTTVTKVTARLTSAPRSELRLRDATAWLATRPAGEEIVIVAASAEAAAEQVRTIAAARGTAFGMHRLTLGRLAGELAKLELA